MKFCLNAIFNIIFIVSIYARDDSLVVPRAVLGIECGYYRYFVKGYPDVGIPEEHLFGYMFGPKILFLRLGDFMFGLQYRHQETIDIVNDTLLHPAFRSVGIFSQYSILFGRKKNFLASCDFFIFMNNYSPTRDGYKYTSRLRLPEVRFNSALSMKIYSGFYVGITVSRSYYFHTNRLFIIRPIGYVHFIYVFIK